MPEGRSPIVYFMAATLFIMGVAGGFLAWDGHKKSRERKRIAAAELAAADQARAAQIREESRQQREAASAQSDKRSQAAIDNALRQLASSNTSIQCDGAIALGRLRARDHRHLLESLLENATSDALKSCAAGGLADMGETATALNAYERWARGDDRGLQRSALVGFGAIGPQAATVALPFLTDALKSARWDDRWIAVDTAAKLGPAGRPLLQMAAGDADQRVRERAALALKQQLP